MLKKNIIFLLVSLPVCLQAQSLSFQKTDDGVWIREGSENVLFYQVATKSVEGKYPRANYIHPLFGIDGFELTEDFPKDHLHHRGIFWTWHQVLIGDKHIGDAWECRDFVWEVQKVEPVKTGKGMLALATKTEWKSPHWLDKNGNQKAFLRERTKITVHHKIDNYRIIDFAISLQALVPELKIGGSDDMKGYGGFSVRMKLPEDIRFTSEEGDIIPAVGPVETGPWMDICGSLAFDGGIAGIVLMCHPDNPMFPEPWILRNKGSMQNPVYPGRAPVEIAESEPTVLKYRLVVYKDKLSPARTKELFEAQ